MSDDNHEDHDDHEGHEDQEGQDALVERPGLRIHSPLSAAAESVMSQAIAAAIAVHRALGPGFLESIYRKAMCIELECRNIAFEKERSIKVSYRGVEIPGQRVDLIVEGLIVVELKAVVS